MDRITPEEIKKLPKDFIFVFGSNEAGHHGAGAARAAVTDYGAYLGQGFGLMNKSFGIPTKDWQILPLALPTIEFYIKRFIEFTKTEPKLNFYVTKIGCGLAGFKVEDIAPMFKNAIDLKNIWLPQDFRDFYAGTYVEKVVEKKVSYDTADRDKAGNPVGF